MTVLTQKKVADVAANRIKAFYEKATDDYVFWSKNFNMHFGHWSKGTNPLDRENMLNEMNRLIIETSCKSKQAGNFVDMGCGVGATVNYANTHFPQHRFEGLTLSPYQVKLGKRHFGKNICLNEGDFSDTNLQTGSFDGAWFLESLCHAADKSKAIQEAARILKPGARLVIADGMLLKKAGQLRFPARQLNRWVADNWEVPEFARVKQVIQLLVSEGFKIENIEDHSFKIAPSVLHSPFLALKHMIINKFKNDAVDDCQTANLKASLAALFLGACRNAFRYYIITARR
ncbi:MAG: MPBQ/MSBQ methyltransferase [Flavobacteriales bacterium]|jgi:MPBQ/MSBQ methyltransferase